MSDSNHITVKPEGVDANSDVGEIRLRQKSKFAIQHMLAAARFSRQCGKVQSENLGKEFGSFYDEQISCVSATVMLCVASLESNINEYLSESESLYPHVDEPARNEFIKLLEPTSILDKYQSSLSFKGIEIFDSGGEPFQSVDTLIALRNELVHFHPEWHDKQERHKKLAKKLAGKFELSPFLKNESSVLFPQRFASHGCTKWAVQSSIEFMEKFAELNGFESKFCQFKSKLHV